MRTETGKAVKLSEYRVPDFLVERVELDFRLDGPNTILVSRLRVSPNPKGRVDAPLQFDGDDLNVIGVTLDGLTLDKDSATIEPDSLTVFTPPREAFTLETRTKLDPAANKQLSGLYYSGGAYCTQCEAEGFRRMTYFPDRPDVLSVYTTRIEADKESAPVLLGNGNPLASGDLAGGRHFAIWHDPFPKPCYLFALVAGNLGSIHDTFTTLSGRMVDLGIYVEYGKEDRAAYAMDALKRSMAWDEKVFGREYDLDVFNIVAVPDFNMGAMENKGLNIFNDKYILASPDTATDADYAHIETVVAHEYFHNWTGNRITCRDWFQLCLKEGLTVYRDQEFSADERSRPVKRIADVRALRAAQFPEDAGPLAHNVRPEVYHEINNFYTATVYQKGAEVIRTLRNFIGTDAFRRGMDLYFQRFDGTAATVEDFIGCFADSSGKSMEQFMLWYSQAGTPAVTVDSKYDARAGRLAVQFEQKIASTPGQNEKKPQVIPISLGLIAADGQSMPLRAAKPSIEGARPEELASGTFILATASRTIVFEEVPSRPALSVLRSFSAPVRIEMESPEEDYLTLAAHDPDLFNRWQAIQTYATRLMIKQTAHLRDRDVAPDMTGFCSAAKSLVADWSADPEFFAQALSLPGDNDIAREIGSDVDPDAIYQAGRFLRKSVGQSAGALLRTAYDDASKFKEWQADSRSAGIRSARGVLLRLIAEANEAEGASLALGQFRQADNMTDRVSALGVLTLFDCPEREAALQEFHDRYSGDHLVLDKWFALQAMIPESSTLARLQALMKHPAFSMTNPNRVRAVVASFAAANPTQFNAADGSGYRFVANVVQELDGLNPQVAARLLASFRSWRTFESVRRTAAEAVLKSIADQPRLSADVRDIVTRTLA